MSTYLRSNLGRTITIVAAIGVAMVSLFALTVDKDRLFHTLGIHTNKGAVLADNTCTVPRERSDEIYFVSCAGFF